MELDDKTLENILNDKQLKYIRQDIRIRKKVNYYQRISNLDELASATMLVALLMLMTLTNIFIIFLI